MTSVVDALPSEVRDVFVEVIGEHDAALLSSLRTQTEPTRENGWLSRIFSRTR
ncbi:hypothetical protein [Saccharopolyspora sp. 5N708]|uniref:hypothetical protein n=1 Tax=Saccharopolyspora sp. 5N708 TaxID=3457424 RepID=UPI003FD03FA0